MLPMIIFSFLMTGFSMNLFADTAPADALQSRYERQLAETAMPEPSPELFERIKTVNRTISSRSWKERQHCYSRDLADALDIDEENTAAPEDQDIPAERDGQLVLFISSSMPEPVINRYAGDLAAVGGVMVMRGGIGGIKKIKPTLAFIHRVLKKDRHCRSADCEVYETDILIHPQLFAANDITQVPALIFVSDDRVSGTCEPHNSGHSSRKADIIYGDVTLAGMIGALYKMTGDDRLQPYPGVLNHE